MDSPARNRSLNSSGAGDGAGEAPRPPGRNDPCPCGSGGTIKRCCLGRRSSGPRSASLPSWILTSPRTLHQFEKYACHVYGLPRPLGSLTDGRRNPEIPTLDVVNSLFHGALLRRPSINALEGDLKNADCQMLIGRNADLEATAFSAEVVYHVLDTLDLEGLRNGIEDKIWRAERNKVFREGSYGALRCVALDGWAPFCSDDRHCPHCLTREVSVKHSTTGEGETRTQYYHRYVVAMFLGPMLDVVLDIEPVLNAEARRDLGAIPEPIPWENLAAAAPG